MRLLLVTALLLGGCTVGSGEGWISGTVFLPECGYPGGDDPTSDGSPFSIPVRYLFGDVVGERIDIRLQNSGAGIHVGDGIVITVRNRHDVVAEILENGSADLPVTAEWPAVPLSGRDLAARASLYLNSSCPDSFVDFTRAVGTVEFSSMYARTDDGDHDDIDLIRGNFGGLAFRDDRPEMAVDGVAPWATIDGGFDFDYTRGRPAQPFP